MLDRKTIRASRGLPVGYFPRRSGSSRESEYRIGPGKEAYDQPFPTEEITVPCRAAHHGEVEQPGEEAFDLSRRRPMHRPVERFL